MRLRRQADWRTKVMSVLRECRPDVPEQTWDPSARFQQDLGFDSLALVAMALRLEEEVGVDPAALTDRAGSITTIADLLLAVEELRQVPLHGG